MLSALYYFAAPLSQHLVYKAGDVTTWIGGKPFVEWFASLSSIPFMNRMGYIFLICFGLAIVASLMQKPKPEAVTVDVNNVDFSTGTSFKIATGAIIAILIALYATWW